MRPKLRFPRATPGTAPGLVLVLIAVGLAVWVAEPVRLQPSPPAAPRTPSLTRASPSVAKVLPAQARSLPSPRFCDDDAKCPSGRCLDGRCSSESGTDSDAGPVADASECHRDRDCAFGERCDRGWCFEGSRTCAEDLECANGSRCAAGRCLQGVRDCESDADCGKRWCDLGACSDEPRPAAGGCHRDSQCPEGRCVAGECRPGLRQCLDARDCPIGLRCTAGLCR
jgi:hypothetical protein